MAAAKNKKVIDLNILGLYKWKSEDCSVKETILVMALSMAFIIILALILKEYALPLIMGNNLFKISYILVGKLKKSRAP